MMVKLPEHIGSLKLIQQIGVGKHCQVWEALDEKARKKVAIKVVVPDMAQDAG